MGIFRKAGAGIRSFLHPSLPFLYLSICRTWFGGGNTKSTRRLSEFSHLSSIRLFLSPRLGLFPTLQAWAINPPRSAFPPIESGVIRRRSLHKPAAGLKAGSWKVCEKIQGLSTSTADVQKLSGLSLSLHSSTSPSLHPFFLPFFCSVHILYILHDRLTAPAGMKKKWKGGENKKFIRVFHGRDGKGLDGVFLFLFCWLVRKEGMEWEMMREGRGEVRGEGGKI